MGRTGREKRKSCRVSNQRKRTQQIHLGIEKIPIYKVMKTPDRYVVMCKDTPRMIPDEIFLVELICMRVRLRRRKTAAKSRTAASLAKRTKLLQENQVGNSSKSRKYTSLRRSF